MNTAQKGLLQDGHPVTLREAQEWTANWRAWSLKNGFTPDTILKAFYIPIGDIEVLANTPKAGGVRAYLALTESGNPGSIKLVLVGTSNSELIGYGKDLIEPIDAADAAEKGLDALYNIYDMTYPCPRFCDVESPLFSDPEPPAATSI